MQDEEENARTAFLDIGKHCSAIGCGQIDFLPFRCLSCSSHFCSLHWRPTDHACKNYDVALADNRIPSCPICSLPVTFAIGSSPDLAMDAHLTLACRVLNPSLPPPSSSSDTTICRAKKCQVKMILPIQCPSCSLSFCAAHRWKEDHSCVALPLSSSSSSSASTRGAAGSTAKSTSAPSIRTKGLELIRRAQLAAKARAEDLLSLNGISVDRPAEGVDRADSTSNSNAAALVAPSASTTKTASAAASSTIDNRGASTSSSTPGRNVFSFGSTKVDKRVKQERESARRGLEARAKRGLLSEDEKLKYATLQALEANESSGSGKGSCVIV